MLATPQLLMPVVERLGGTATLKPSSGPVWPDRQVLAEVLDAPATWVQPVARRGVD